MTIDFCSKARAGRLWALTRLRARKFRTAAVRAEKHGQSARAATPLRLVEISQVKNIFC